jgi:hypothetical protein
MSKASRSRVRVVALPLIAALALASCSSSQQSGGVTVPRSAISRLTALASQFATANGDSNPRWAAVEVTVPRGVEVSAGMASNRTMAYLVVMRGHFTAYMSSPPSNAATPTGRYLFIVIGPRTFRLRGWGVGNKLPPAWLAIRGSLTSLHIAAPGHQDGLRRSVS